MMGHLKFKPSFPSAPGHPFIHFLLKLFYAHISKFSVTLKHSTPGPAFIHFSLNAS